MPTKNRKPTNPGETADEPSFEEAILELESIVEAMENEQLPLNELIDQYEKGVRLYSTCDKLLGQARERLELITIKAREQQGPAKAKSAMTEPSAEGDPDDDDIRLF